MSKRQLVVLIALSAMRPAAALLRALDSNSTGADDEAAKALDAAVAALEVYVVQ